MSFSVRLLRVLARKRSLLAGVVKDSEPQHEQLPLAEHPHSTKLSRQAVGVATHLGMKHHGFKQTGEKSPFWVFEHRSRHLRDHAEGRNHRLPSK